MKFKFTMNMPSRNGNPVHQVIGEHRAQNLTELLDVIQNVDFLIVEEFYAYSDRNTGDVDLQAKGSIAINPTYIGKITLFEGD